MADAPALERLVDALGNAGRIFWPVWVVLGAIAVFMIVHGRFDRRDPKLASAPLTDEVLGFS